MVFDPLSTHERERMFGSRDNSRCGYCGRKNNNHVDNVFPGQPDLSEKCPVLAPPEEYEQALKDWKKGNQHGPGSTRAKKNQSPYYYVGYSTGRQRGSKLAY
ncbi:MAG: hypothetical protein ABIE68_00100 [bacterium]